LSRLKKTNGIYGKSNKEQIQEIIKKPTEKFLTKSQKEFWHAMDENLITLCTGPAGTGKSYISLLKAISLLYKDNDYEKIVILRPIVTAGDKDVLGSLPGTLSEKMDPYVFPSFYLLNKIIGNDARLKLLTGNFIEVMALSFCRGVNFDNSIVVFEEAQNATIEEMKLVLTRIGFNTKMFISGDLEQSDKFKDITKSGLYDAKVRLVGIKGIGEFGFSTRDIVRNEIISAILEKYKNEVTLSQ
jgi:phosphate starvation-inducible PhoH-like protein